MFESRSSVERAITVSIGLNGQSPDVAEVAELQELVSSAGAHAVAHVSGRRQHIDPKLFVGAGKAEELRELASELCADIVVFDHALSPAQERNLERSIGCRVLDRTGLILDIFAQRAKTHEGKLQVELAQLEHLSTRLVRGWTHLERQKGGIGLRGPGETQLETDRRLIRQRIRQIRKRLEKVSQQRDLGREARRRSALATVSLVGYTNAGKSTLFNTLTQAEVYAANQLFATLDPTIRRVCLPGAGPMVLADTVGFIRQLPHDLVAAFRATLEETCQAALLLHVVDASDPRRDILVEQVNRVLAEIGAEEIPQLLVYNKIDCLDDTPGRLERDSRGRISAVWLSVRSGAGMDLLLQALSERLGEVKHRRWLKLSHQQARLRAILYDREAVLREIVDTDGWQLEVNLNDAQLGQLGSFPALRDFSSSPLDEAETVRQAHA